MFESESLQQPEPDPSVRELKIEAEGDAWKGLIKPKIRLMGRWLERAGFRPGNSVHVTCVAPGMIELRSADALMEDSKPTASDQSEQSF
jgi:Toxin SymE, type I toxin-antitoxin system